MNESNQTLVHYLLGELPAAEQTALEEKYFADPELFDQVVETENELVDQYARGQLSPAAQQRFEQYYLGHPRRRERARFAQALSARVDRIPEVTSTSSPAEPWWRHLLTSLQGPKLAFAFSLALLLLIAGVIWLALDTRRLHQELARSEAERARQEQRERDLQQQLAGERTRSEQMASELNRAPSNQLNTGPAVVPSSAPALATLILNVSGVRGAETGAPATLNLPSGAKEARIQLNLKDVDYPAYAVLIQSADGKQIFGQGGLRSRGKTRATLSVIVPANRLSAGDYVLTLRGVSRSGDLEDVSKSLFLVTRR